MTGAPCTDTALLYSGQPDPHWAISARQVEHLQDLWQRLPATKRVLPTMPPLGYRGAVVECSSGRRWWAYGGNVESTTSDDVPEYRLDTVREFEHAILTTAPAGTLPQTRFAQ